jgi:hypothetical protein
MSLRSRRVLEVISILKAHALPQGPARSEAFFLFCETLGIGANGDFFMPKTFSQF